MAARRIILGVVLLAAAVGNCEASALKQHQHQDVQVRLPQFLEIILDETATTVGYV